MRAFSNFLCALAHVGLVLVASLWPAVPTWAQSAQYRIDPTHTFVTFEIKHFGTSTNRGRFDRKEGVVRFDKTTQQGSVDITLDMASVSTGTPAFDAFLQGFQMFDAPSYPSARFVSERFDLSGTEGRRVIGWLTLLDQTHEVVLTATQFNCYFNPLFRREVCGGDFEATLDRTQWGLNYGLAFGFPKVVKLLIQVEAIRQ